MVELKGIGKWSLEAITAAIKCAAIAPMRWGSAYDENEFYERLI